MSTGEGNPNAIFVQWEITHQIQNKSRKAGNSKTYGLSTKFVRVDWAREPKCYICAMGNYKPHHVIILSHFQFHSIHYKTEEPGCRWADKQLVSVRITYQKWGQIMYEVELEILKTSWF